MAETLEFRLSRSPRSRSDPQAGAPTYRHAHPDDEAEADPREASAHERPDATRLLGFERDDDVFRHGGLTRRPEGNHSRRRCRAPVINNYVAGKAVLSLY